MAYIAAEDILAARQIDLLTYLQTYEPGELVKLPGDNYCTREHDGRIFNLWILHGRFRSMRPLGTVYGRRARRQKRMAN